MTDPDRQEPNAPAGEERPARTDEARTELAGDDLIVAAAGLSAGPTPSSMGEVSRILGRDPRWFAALLISVTIIAVFAAISVVGAAIFAFGDTILIFFLAWLIAFIVTPFASGLKHLVRPLPQAAAVLIVYLVAIVALVLAILVVAANLATSISQFVQSIPTIEANLGQYLAPWQERLNALGLSVDLTALVHSVLDNLQTGAVDVVGPIQQVAVASISVIGSVLIISILSIYIAIDRKRILAFLFRLTPSAYRTEAELLRVSVNRSFGGFLRGQVIMGAVYGLIVALISVIFGLKLVPITATTSGVLMAIPFFGPFVAWIPPVLDALIFNPDVVLPVLILSAIGWFVVMNILQPRLMAGAVGLHPIVVLASVIIGGKIAGVAGAIFGIPIAAIVTAFFWHYLEEQTGETIAQRAARRVERREGRRIRVPKEPRPGIDPEVEDELEDGGLSAGASSSR
jgi:predicted PurR-regulated permease PerM